MFEEGLTTFIRMFLLAYTGNHSDFDNIYCKDGMSASNVQNLRTGDLILRTGEMESRTGMSGSNVQNLRTGDLILRTGENKPGSLFYHAGVYSGNEEVIDFSFQTEEGHSLPSWSASLKGKGSVSKTGRHLFTQNKPFCVLRLRSGIPKNFNDIVQKAMNHEEDYNLLTNNCLHFALRLLGVRWINHDNPVYSKIITNWLNDDDFYGKAKEMMYFFVEVKQVGFTPALMGSSWSVNTPGQFEELGKLMDILFQQELKYELFPSS
ncbi:hypothetical protein E1301_Tti015313 [Triplophysa tibetana]|uniref:LRAT domain-containing protein n=1 Tax=Triplophysa tibetana TaxID=1572043 RepID=A0A5A9PR21_9TELE|nr:hypothetical protein E1301_Tti015313 [Triplophysa tibetana]